MLSTTEANGSVVEESLAHVGNGQGVLDKKNPITTDKTSSNTNANPTIDQKGACAVEESKPKYQKESSAKDHVEKNVSSTKHNEYAHSRSSETSSKSVFTSASTKTRKTSASPAKTHVQHSSSSSKNIALQDIYRREHLAMGKNKPNMLYTASDLHLLQEEAAKEASKKAAQKEREKAINSIASYERATKEAVAKSVAMEKQMKEAQAKAEVLKRDKDEMTARAMALAKKADDAEKKLKQMLRQEEEKTTSSNISGDKKVDPSPAPLIHTKT